MTDKGSKNPTQKSIERWEGEGGATRSGPQTSSKRKRAGDTNQLANNAKRRLGPDEKQRIAEERRLKEIAAHPNKMIAVNVQDETDESGAPILTVQHIGESARDRKNRKS